MLPAHWAMVVGGYNQNTLNIVELISLDPVNHPVPDCLKQLGNFPVGMHSAGGAALKDGKFGR